MEQKQRDKIAWILSIVLVPLLIYLLMTNIAKVRKPSSPPAPPAPPPVATIAVPAGAPDVPPPVQPPTQQSPPVDQKVLAEQKRIAALLPENNPFNPSRSGGSEPAPAAAVPKTTAPPPMAPPPAATIRLTAIVARGSGRMAMINGRFLGEGDRIADWTIIKVTATEVLLDNGAKKMVLRLR